ncbi:unnamed protein product [Oikopleura dioica]|uniref:Peptidase metallopeptidase domain-containing protein n=1 Tax=Oikopleura dioica TaxID=34765 RepID=E4Y3W7_OIKDI|nr:unnamed protein product [Oikopleura dioica]
MKLFAATLATLAAAETQPDDWHNGEYGDMIIQRWQVPEFKKLGYLEEKMNIDKSTPNKIWGYRGLVTWARLFKNYNSELANGRYVVPYAMQNTVPAQHHQQIHDELADFSKAMGCVEFVHDPTFSYANGVHIAGETSDGSGCWSYVGACPGCTNDMTGIQAGWQALRLPNWCIGVGGIHHEFLHAVGYMHEQDRPDYADWIVDRADAGAIDPSAWIDTGHPFEPASNVMYSGFNLLNGRSYSPHPLLTTTDAVQGYELYCDAKRDTHPMEPMSMCIMGDHVDVLRPVFQHKLCDGFSDCYDGEDEDGRLADCSTSPPTLMPCANHNCGDDYMCQNNDDGVNFDCICRSEPCGTTTEGPGTTEDPGTDSPPDTTQTTPWTTTSGAPVVCGCTPACTDGYTCDNGECVDVDECMTGDNYCNSFEYCVNTNGNFRCDPNEDLLADCTWNAQWKGRQTTKYVFKGDETVVLASKFRVKNSPVNPRTDLYQGFVTWTKDVCGNDFLKKIRSGEVGISLVDTEDIYRIKHKYYKNDGKYTMGGFSFELTDIVTKDTPWAFKSGTATKNMASDDVQIVLTGIDKVSFLDSKGMDWCLLTAANALMPADTDYPDHVTMCIIEGKKFWKAPAEPNA